MLKFYCYSRCGTCKKAEKFLVEQNIPFEKFEITENHFDLQGMKDLHQKSNKPLKQIFNTSGNVYKELNLKDRLNELTLDEAYQLLASNGMLIKRPILAFQERVLFGFKEEEYKELIRHVKGN
jgi:arsenate reductase (glutaredoxin)